MAMSTPYSTARCTMRRVRCCLTHTLTAIMCPLVPRIELRKHRGPVERHYCPGSPQTSSQMVIRRPMNISPESMPLRGSCTDILGQPPPAAGPVYLSSLPALAPADFH